jgi:hypothetical protein
VAGAHAARELHAHVCRAIAWSVVGGYAAPFVCGWFRLLSQLSLSVLSCHQSVQFVAGDAPRRCCCRACCCWPGVGAGPPLVFIV